MNNTPKVSVIMLAYNHEKFVSQAIDSILNQKVSFPYEIVIGEDCSTDATAEIVSAYQKQLPEKIRVISDSRNVGMARNLLRIYPECRGEFVAILEGDDFWTDPLKLQKQVELMGQDAGIALCHHLVHVQYDCADVNHDSLFRKQRQKWTTFEDILEQNTIASCSVVFRRALLQELPDWFVGLNLLDWPLFLLLAKQGKVACLLEEMATYRVHQGGSWSLSSSKHRVDSTVEMYRRINRHFEFHFDKLIRKHISLTYLLLAQEFDRACDHKAVLACLSLCLKEDISQLITRTSQIARLAIKSQLPGFYRAAKLLKASV